MNEDLFVGFSRVNISPNESVPLAGFGNSSARMSQSILTPIYSTCLAITDNHNKTVLLFHNDLCTIPVEFSDPVRNAVSASTGVPYEQIMVTATHNHTAPDLNNRKEPTIVNYIQTVTERMQQCAAAAMADRKPATMEVAKVETEGLNFVRHYVLSDGTYKGDNFGTLNKNPIVGHVSQADGTMQIVKFVIPEGKDIWTVNFQGHPHRASGPKTYHISSDIVGVMRDELEQIADCRFLYFTGASGNLNCGSRIAEENLYEDYIAVGKAMSVYAKNAVFKTAGSGHIKMQRLIHNEPINRPDPSKLAHAREIGDLWLKTNDSKLVVPLAVSYGINSPYAANSILARNAMKQNELCIELNVLGVGEVAFVFAPYEMFDTQGKYIRDHSGFETTIIATCANDANGYIPSEFGFEYGCYESDLCFFKAGTGEYLADLYVDMLSNVR